MKKTFAVPEDKARIYKECVALVIQSIPDSWAVLRGILHAPPRMIDCGEASGSTKWVFGSEIHEMIDHTGPDQIADVFGSLIEGKKPAWVEFGRNFTACEVMPMDQSKRMAEHFIRLGYRGRLTFRWLDREDREPIPSQCEIWMPSPDPDMLPIFRIEQNDEGRVHREHTTSPILKACEELGLALLETE